MIEVENQLEENRNWWESAYGVEETAVIAELPAEVRRALYPHGMKFGPASEEIGAFFAAYVKLSHELAPEDWSVFTKKLGHLPTTQDNYYHFYLQEARGSSERVHLTSRFFEGAYSANNDAGPLALICWLMSARFFFDDEMLERSVFLVEPVNEILAEMKLPPLIWGRRNKEQV